MKEVTFTPELLAALKELLNTVYGTADIEVGEPTYNRNLATIDVDVDGVELNIGESTMTLQLYMPFQDTVPCWHIKTVQKNCPGAAAAWVKLIKLASSASLKLE